MPASTERIKELIIKRLDDTLTAPEQQELDAWMNVSPLNREVADEFLDEKKLKLSLRELYLSKEKVWQRLNEAIPDKAIPDKKVVPLYQRSIFRWGVAASVVLLLVGGYWFVAPRQARGDKEQIAIVHDVQAPTIARATLKLANGNIVYLDSVGNGQLAMQGNVSVVKSGDGKLVYSQESGVGPSTGSGQEIKYNTVSNPRGSKVQMLTLIDGTQVWLNAASSITYPTAFVGDERRVTITGEAYFEVAHLPLTPSKGGYVPFFVEANGTTTEVLGTHFNVNAYDDEDAIRVTLLEGSVRLTQNAQSKLLEPGEQGIANLSVPSSGSGLRVTKDVNVEQVMAWKNGKFDFGVKTDLGSIMRQLSRWYNVTITYKNGVPALSFGGEIPSSSSLSQVLDILKTSGVHYTVENNQLTVSH